MDKSRLNRVVDGFTSKEIFDILIEGFEEVGQKGLGYLMYQSLIKLKSPNGVHRDVAVDKMLSKADDIGLLMFDELDNYFKSQQNPFEASLGDLKDDLATLSQSDPLIVEDIDRDAFVREMMERINDKNTDKNNEKEEDK